MNTEEKKVIKNYLKVCATTSSEGRLKKIETTLRKVREMIKKDLTKLETKDVVNFLGKLNQSDYGNWTKNDYKKIFKRFLKWKYKDLEMIEGDEVKEGFKGVSKTKAFNKEKINKETLLKKEEFDKMFRSINNLKWKAIVSLCYESAFRPCEIRALRWKNIKFSDGEDICRITIKSPKTGQVRTIPVKDCIVDLKRWKKEYQFPDLIEEDYVFPSQRERDKPLGDGVITEMFKRISKKAGIRNIFPYMMRHTRIYHIQKKIDPRKASKFAGHSLETSEIYDHLDDDDVEESMIKEVFGERKLSKEKKHKLEKQMEEMQQKLLRMAEEHQETQKMLMKERVAFIGEITK